MAGGNEKKIGYVIAVIVATVLGMIVGAGGTLFVTRNVWGGKEADTQVAQEESGREADTQVAQEEGGKETDTQLAREEGESEETGQESILAEDGGEPAAAGTDKGEPAPEHDWREATCTEAKTCTICGETEGEPLGHAWQEATCKAPKICSVCSATEGELAEHAFDGNGTCSVCYLRKIELTWENVYDYLDASCSTPRSDGANYRVTVTIRPVSNTYSFQDVQIHIGLNLQRYDGQQIELLYDAPLDFNFNDREHYYDLSSDGTLTIEGHFPKDYTLDEYRPLMLDLRGYCIGR